MHLDRRFPVHVGHSLMDRQFATVDVAQIWLTLPLGAELRGKNYKMAVLCRRNSKSKNMIPFVYIYMH